MKMAILVLFWVCTSVALCQQPPRQVFSVDAGQYNIATRIDAPSLYLDRNDLGRAPTSTFNVQFSSDYPTNLQPAFSRAVEIWSYLINSSQTINISVRWNPLSGNTLMQAKVDSMFANFQNAPQPNTWYPVALAEAISNLNLNGSLTEMTIDVDSTGSQWYAGLDGNAPVGNYDLVTTAMHEIAHGLGFYHSFRVNGLNGSWGISASPIIYDAACMVGNNHGTSTYKLTNTSQYPNPSQDLGNALRGDNVYFDGLNTFQIYNNSLPKLYAPPAWSSGSSIAHLDELTFLPGNSNSLMSPTLNPMESIHSPGEIGMAILQDLGWSINRTITITSPMAGKIWAPGTSDTLRWTDNKYLGGPLSIQLWKRNTVGGYDFHSTVANVTSVQGHNFHVWTASVDTGTYRFKMLHESEGYGMSVAFLVAPLQQVARPVITPPGGIVTGTVQITCATSGATIYYTTNGEDPNQGSQPYSAPITIPYSCVLRARAYKSGMSPSQIREETFFVPGSPSPPIITPLPGTYPAPLTLNIAWAPGTTCFINETYDGNAPCDPINFSCQFQWTDNQQTRNFPTTWRLAARTYGNGQWSPLASYTYTIVPSLRVSQSDSANLPFGTWAKWESSWHYYPDTIFARPGSPQTWTLLANQGYKPGTSQKYYVWRKNDVTDSLRNHTDLIVDEFTSSVKGVFNHSTAVNVQAKLIENDSVGGTIDFKDPWLIDTSDAKGPKNRGLAARWHNVPSPFNPAAGGTYKGAFMNQNPEWLPNRPNYSVGAPNPNTISGFQSHFFGWDDFDPNQLGFQNPSAQQTGVVFKQAGVTATAKYKGHRITTSSNVTSSATQRKIMRDDNGRVHMVYESVNHIWYTWSSNGGSTWQPEVWISDAVELLHRSPSLTVQSNPHLVVVVWDSYLSDHSVHIVLSRTIDPVTAALGGPVIVGDLGSHSQTQCSTTKPEVGYGSSGGGYVLCAWHDSVSNKITGSIRTGSNPDVWGSPMNLVTPSGLISSFSLAPGTYGAQKWHLAWKQGDSLMFARLNVNLSPSVTPEVVATVGGIWHFGNDGPSVVGLGSHYDGTGIVWREWSDEAINRHVKYRERSSGGSWGTTTYAWTTNGVGGVGAHLSSPTITVHNASLYPAIVWQKGTDQVQLTKKLVSVWTKPGTIATGITPTVGTSFGDSTSDQPVLWRGASYPFPLSTTNGAFGFSSAKVDFPNANPTDGLPEGRGGVLKFDGGTVYVAIVQAMVDTVPLGFRTIRDTARIGNLDDFMAGIVTERFRREGTLRLRLRYGSNGVVPGSLTFRILIRDAQTGEQLTLIRSMAGGRDTVMTISTQLSFGSRQITLGIEPVGIDKPGRFELERWYVVPDDQSSDRIPLTATPSQEGIPKENKLHQNHPNPFNPTTNIEYSLAEAGQVSLIVYDIVGREVVVLENGMKSAGAHVSTFEATRFSSGVYLYKLQSGNFTAVRKMVLTK